MMRASAYGKTLATAFQAVCEHAIYSRTPDGVTMAVTLLTSIEAGVALSPPLARSDAYLVLAFVEPPDSFAIHLSNGRTRSFIPSRESALVLDLRDEPRVSCSGTFRSVNIYLPRRAVFGRSVPLVDSRDVEPDTELKDPALCGIARSLCVAGNSGYAFPETELVREVLLLACTSLARDRGLDNLGASRALGLSGEKCHEAVSYMEERLDESCSMMEVADACRLSYNAFTKGFKRSLGASPRDWYMVRRVERAKELMTNLPIGLGDIAAHMGFSDQSHFNRTFVRYVGITPGAWRRRRQACSRPRRPIVPTTAGETW